MEIINPTYIFNLPTLCKHGIDCTKQNCNYTHPLGKFSKQNKLYDYYVGKQNILFTTYNFMKKKYNNQVVLQCFYNNFYNFNYDGILSSKYLGLNHNIVPTPYFLIENALVLNHGADRLGGGVLSKGFVQEEIKTIVSTLLGAFVSCHGWKNLTYPMRNSLINDPFVIRMEQFADIDKLYGTGGVYAAVKQDIVDENVKILDNVVKFDWMCMAFQKFKYTDGREYNLNLLTQMFITSYKTFVIALDNAVANQIDNKINILIGNIGCGAFNHCIHVTYSIVVLALYCAVIQVGKNVNTYYCAYDEETLKELYSEFGAVNFINSCKDNLSIKGIIEKIMGKIKKYGNWRNKFVIVY